MKKKIKFLFTSYLVILLFGTISCEDDCGGISKYNITSLNGNTYKAIYSETFSDKLVLSEIIQSSVLYNEYSINITTQTETDYSLINELNSFNLISSAYACSPVPPSTEDKIENIEIFANLDFNPDNSIGKDLVNLFDIVILDIQNNLLYEKFGLKAYLMSKPYVPQEMTLILKESPEETADFEFTIKYYQNGKKMNYFEFTTNPIEIRTE